MICHDLVKANDFWYVIGLIATDGSLSKDGKSVNITSKEESHLIAVKKALHSNNAIGKKARGYSKDKKYSQLQLCDVVFYRFLQEIGLTPKKSLTLGSIQVDMDYFSDFIRGVVDGDGCIKTWVHPSNLHRQWGLQITSAAPIFIAWLKQRMQSFFDVRGSLYTYPYNKNPIHVLRFGKLASKVILSSIYYKDCLCLARKQEKSLKCLQDPDRMINYGGVKGPGGGTGRRA